MSPQVIENYRPLAIIDDNLRARMETGDIAQAEIRGESRKKEAEEPASRCGGYVMEDDEDGNLDEDADWSHNEKGEVER